MNYDFLLASNGSGDAALMHITADRIAGSTTIVVDGVTNVPAKFFGTYGTLLSSGFIDLSTKRDFRGHTSGGNLIIDAFEPGNTDNGNTSGQVVVIKPSTPWANRVATFIRNATGYGTPDAVTFAAATVASLASAGDATVGGDLKLSGTAPTIQATGAAASIPINLKPKGKSQVKVNGLNIFGGYDYFASGCVWSADAAGSTLNASMTAGVVVINGVPLTVAAVTARAFAASKDTYVDFRDNGDGTAVPVYNAVTNNAASQALTAGDIRNAVIVTGATNIAAASSINQGQPERSVPTTCNVGRAGIDSLGNKIYRRNPYEPLIFTAASTLQGNGDVISLTLPLLASSKLVIKGEQSGEWVNTPSIDTYSNLFVDGANIQQSRIDTDATSRVWIAHPHSQQTTVAAGSRIVKLNNSHGGAGNAQFISASLMIWVYPG